jgi:hypothetical protein
MNTALQFDLLMAQKTCRCGGQLVYDGRFYVCAECNHIYCPECFGYIVACDGCFTCMNCGFSLCG